MCTGHPGSVVSVGRADINRYGRCVRETLAERFGSGEGSASNSELVVVAGDVLGGGSSNETRAKEKNLLLGGLGGDIRWLQLGQDVDTIFKHRASKLWKSQVSSAVDIRIVVFRVWNSAERGLEISTSLFRANHDTDLTGGIYLYQLASLNRQHGVTDK